MPSDRDVIFKAKGEAGPQAAGEALRRDQQAQSGAGNRGSARGTGPQGGAHGGGAARRGAGATLPLGPLQHSPRLQSWGRVQRSERQPQSPHILRAQRARKIRSASHSGLKKR